MEHVVGSAKALRAVNQKVYYMTSLSTYSRALDEMRDY